MVSNGGIAAMIYGPWPEAGWAVGPLAKAPPPFLTHSRKFAGSTGLVFGSVLLNAAVPSGPNNPARPGAGMALSLSLKLWQVTQLAWKTAWPRPAGVNVAAPWALIACCVALKLAATCWASCGISVPHQCET